MGGDTDSSSEPRIVTSAANQAEAELLCGHLISEGIKAMVRRSFGGPEMGGSGTRDVLVNGRDLERARALLQSVDEPFSEQELARLSEQAGREAGET